MERNENGENELGILTVSIHTGVSDGELDEETLGKHVNRSEDKSKYKKAYTGDLVFNMMRAWQGAIGSVKTSGMVSPAYIVAKPIKQFDSTYMDYYFKTKIMIDKIHKLSYGVTDFRLRLYWNSFTSIHFYLPKDMEQRKISIFLSLIDKKISLQINYHELLKLYKKGLLSKMFPQNGEKQPELRLGGFTEDWEQRKFSDFTWDAGKRNKDNLDLEPYAITNEHGFIPQSEAHDEFGYMKDTDRRAYNIVAPNSFAYNPARINVGSIGYYEGTENVIVSSLYEVFQTADYVDDRFLWHWFKSGEFPKWIERLQEGSVRLYFYYDKLCECQMLMPSVEEQRHIASYLDELDTLITLHQRKYEMLLAMKKSLLQEMFI